MATTSALRVLLVNCRCRPNAKWNESEGEPVRGQGREIFFLGRGTDSCVIEEYGRVRANGSRRLSERERERALHYKHHHIPYHFHFKKKHQSGKLD